MNTIRVTVAYSIPGGGEEIVLDIPVQSKVQDAINAAQVVSPEIAGVAKSAIAVGIWGKVRPLDAGLRDGDRVELYRALQADPKDARRDNAKHVSGKSKRM